MKNILFNEFSQVDVVNVNMLAKKNPKKFVKLCEQYYDNQLAEIAEYVNCNKDIKIILLAGPSGSGKTTTAMKLSEKISKLKKNAIYISLDDFYINRDNLPKLENGKIDYESVHTLDIDAIRKCFCELLENGSTNAPIFDFVSGKRDLETYRELTLSENDVMIVEGLHALNPLLTRGVNKKDGAFLKLFVNPESQIFSTGGASVLRRRELRLMRRMIRDFFFRASSPVRTLELWENVCAAEEENVIPFKSDADIIVDTAHFYEPCVYHNYLLPILKDVNTDNEEYKDTLRNLEDKLEIFYDLDKKVIPANSMIREFVGK